LLCFNLQKHTTPTKTLHVCLLLLTAPIVTYAQGLAGLPLHAHSEKELAALEGPKSLTKNEIVIWCYPFAWNAISEARRQVNLERSILYRFLGQAGSAIYLETEDGTKLTTLLPPYIAGIRSVVRVANIRAVGAPLEIISNRIGNPTSIRKEAGRTILRYTASRVSYSQTRYDTMRSTFTGGGLPPSTVTTEIPRTEYISYIPYDFELIVGESGRVEQVIDKVAE
jgi:hypothetical protein